MQQRISFVTLAVSDLDAARRFYLDGLGWIAELDVPGEVVMIRAGQHLVLSLWDAAGFEGEVGPIRQGEGVVPLTLAHNVATAEEVDAVLELARAAGADPVSPAQTRDWGGYTGYFGDPDGFRWEIAVNPGPIGVSVLPAAAAPGAHVNEHGQRVGAAVADWTPRPFPDITTMQGRWCRVEPLGEHHAAELYAEVAGPGNAALWTYAPSGPFRERADFAEYLERSAADSASVTVVIRDGDGFACGLVSSQRIDPGNGSVEIGSIVLGPRLQRTSAATEAMFLLARHVFGLGYRRLEWKCDSLNEPSRRAAERFGFVHEGTFRNAVVYKGRSRDTEWFSITDAEWPRLATALQHWLAPGNHEDGRQKETLRAFRSS